MEQKLIKQQKKYPASLGNKKYLTLAYMEMIEGIFEFIKHISVKREKIYKYIGK